MDDGEVRTSVWMSEVVSSIIVPSVVIGCPAAAQVRLPGPEVG